MLSPDDTAMEVSISTDMEGGSPAPGWAGRSGSGPTATT
jgi:hypothetical protein